MRILCGGISRGGARRGERGAARLNFVIVLAIIVALSYVGFQMFPVFYRSKTFESFMQDTVNNAAVTDKNAAWVEQQLKKSLADYEVPSDAIIKSTVRDGKLEAQVQFTQTIPLVVTEYHYSFDKTVRSSTGVTGG
ncbi:MAG: hypothetical protein ACJ741_10040 [Pyrinomonadaceae bacterium]